MKNKSLVHSFKNAINGIVYVLKKERNMKFHACAAIIVLALSFLYRLSRTEFMIVCLTVGLVIICELFNTAVEMIMDIIVDVYHPKVKKIKDIAAGAVLVSAIISLIVGYLIFFDKRLMLLP